MRALLILLSIFLQHNIAQAADSSTIIAVAAGSNSQKSIVATINHAAFFLLFNNDGEFLKSIPNPHKDNVGDAAADLAKQGATVLVAQSFDRASLEAITAQDVIPIRKKGVVSRVIQNMTACEEPEKK